LCDAIAPNLVIRWATPIRTAAEAVEVVEVADDETAGATRVVVNEEGALARFVRRAFLARSNRQNGSVGLIAWAHRSLVRVTRFSTLSSLESGLDVDHKAHAPANCPALDRPLIALAHTNRHCARASHARLKP
jgi:hypothetical protein